MLRRMHKGSVKLEVTRGADHRLVRWVRRQRGLRRKDLLRSQRASELAFWPQLVVLLADLVLTRGVCGVRC